LSSRRANPQGGGGVWAGTGNGEVGVECYSDFVLSAMGAAPIMGLSFGGDQKRLMLFFFFVTEEGWFLEDGVSASKPKKGEEGA
jgi:hypothetical protein